MAEKEEFRDLMAQVAAGSEDASVRFLRRFGPGLLQAVRRRLPQRLRPQFDSLDFAQDVWASFFAVEEKPDFVESKHLVAFLARVAQNKVVDAVRARLQCQKRNVNREQPLPDSSTLAAAIPQLAIFETPSQAVSNSEQWQKVLNTQPPLYRQVLLQLQQGKSVQSVARDLGISERTIARIIARISERIASAGDDW